MSFRAKTIVGIALIEAVVLLILVWSSINYLARASEAEMAIRAQSVSETFANLIRDAVLATDLALLESVADQALQSPELAYVRFTDGERILAQAGVEEQLMKPFHVDARLGEIRDGIFDYGVDILHAGEVLGRVELGIFVSRAVSLITDAETHLVGIALLEMLLVALFSYVLGAYLTRGLSKLTCAADAITDGAVGATVEIRGRDELATAARAFNAMSTRLAESHRKMQHSISRSKRLSAEIGEQRLRLSTILSTAVDGFITIDERGIIESINPAGAKLFGYDARELVGTNVSKLMPAAYRNRRDGNLKAYRETGVSKIIGVGREVSGKRKNGSSFPIDISVSEMRINGKRMYVGLVRDISERKRIEQEAQKNAAIKSAVLDANLDALIMIDERGNIVDFSTAAETLLLYSRDKVLGRSIFSLILPPGVRAAYLEGITRYDRTGEDSILGKRVEINALRHGGEAFPAELTLQPIKTEQEVMFAAFVRDISERKQAEEELKSSKIEAESASDAKSRFLAHMSHEIRSPLNAVLVSIGLLLDSDLDKDQRLYAKTARESGNSLLGLINDILDFSKIEAGQLKLDSHPFKLSDMIAETLDIMALRIDDPALNSLVLVDPRIPQFLLGDKLRLRQILINLLDNAIKFTESGALVLELHELERCRQRSLIRFSVQDTGIGISRRDQEKLFQEFQQADDSDSAERGGTGLGLSICQALCHAMGGSIRLTSKLGHGTCFQADIPIDHDPGQASSPPPVSVASARRTLFVGFHDLIRQSLQSYSGTHNFLLDTADSLGEAIDLLRRHPDIILVNANLPPREIASLAREARQYGIKYRVLVAHRAHHEAMQWLRDGEFDDLHTMPLMINFADDLLQFRSGDVIDELNRTQEIPLPAVLPSAGAKVKKGRILLAEDSPANQVVSMALLDRAGFEVDVVENGQQAVEAFVENDYDLILMDLRMPLLNGLEATRTIRSREDGGTIPIIALTANASKHDVDRCRASGMDDFVAKPVDKKRLLSVLERYLPPSHADEPGPGNLSVEELVPSSADRGESGDSIPLFDQGIFDRLTGDVSAEFVPQMVNLFIEEIGDRGARIQNGLTTLPLQTLLDEAHTIKSSAGAFGALKLQTTARAMESACIQEDRVTAENLGSILEKQIQRTLVIFRERLEILDRSGNDEVDPGHSE